MGFNDSFDRSYHLGEEDGTLGSEHARILRQQQEYNRKEADRLAASMTVDQPPPVTVSMGSGAPVRPDVAFGVFAAIAGALVWLVYAQVVPGVLAAIGTFGVFKGLQHFSRTEMGRRVAAIVPGAVFVGLSAGAVYLTWIFLGRTPALWLGAIIGCIAAVAQLQLWWRRFASTPAGQTMVRRSRLILRISVLGALACGAAWIWSKGYL
jgi:hypothetical protein